MGRVSPHMPSALHRALFRLVSGHERLVAHATGDVLELGGGLNAPYYVAAARVSTVEAGRATALPEGTFDTIVCAFALCTEPDPVATLTALAGRLRDGGRLLFLEHVRGGGARAAMQRAAGVGWPRLFDGCHPDRDAVASIRQAGFLVTDVERFSIRLAAPVVSPAVRGTARIAA